MTKQTRWFLTADFLSKGKRGVFCSRTGQSPVSDTQHSDAEIQEAFGPFVVLMNAQSVEMNEAELSEYTTWVPLEEYKCQWGLAYKDRADNAPGGVLPEEKGDDRQTAASQG